jgi:hypothetical protein
VKCLWCELGRLKGEVGRLKVEVGRLKSEVGRLKDDAENDKNIMNQWQVVTLLLEGNSSKKFIYPLACLLL